MNVYVMPRFSSPHLLPHTCNCHVCKLFSKQKFFCFFLNPLDHLRVSNHWTISENPFIGQPSDRVHWKNLRYIYLTTLRNNLLDNPPIWFIGQPSDIICWTTLRYNLLDNPPSTHFIHALTPDLRDIPVHMR